MIVSLTIVILNQNVFHPEKKLSSLVESTLFSFSKTDNYVITNISLNINYTNTNEIFYSNKDIKVLSIARHDTSIYSDIIYLDWPKESHKLTYLNYKSVESLLSVYPEAKFECLTIGPNAANYYKVGDVLRYSIQKCYSPHILQHYISNNSKHTFEKYLKRGYDIRTKVVDRIITSDTTGAIFYVDR